MTRKYEVLVLTRVFVEAASKQAALDLAEYVAANQCTRIHSVRGEFAREISEDEWQTLEESLK